MGRTRVTAIDAEILIMVYDNVDWKNRVWFVDDFLERITVSRPTLLYHLRKLVRAEMLREVKSYPKGWQAGDDKTKDLAEAVVIKIRMMVRK